MYYNVLFFWHMYFLLYWCVVVTLQPPPLDTWNGDLYGFTLEYREISDDIWSSQGTQQDVTLVVLNELVLFMTYEFKVRAFNVYGESPWSQIHIYFHELGTLSWIRTPPPLRSRAVWMRRWHASAQVNAMNSIKVMHFVWCIDCLSWFEHVAWLQPTLRTDVAPTYSWCRVSLVPMYTYIQRQS